MWRTLQSTDLSPPEVVQQDATTETDHPDAVSNNIEVPEVIQNLTQISTVATRIGEKMDQVGIFLFLNNMLKSFRWNNVTLSLSSSLKISRYPFCFSSQAIVYVGTTNLNWRLHCSSPLDPEWWNLSNTHYNYFIVKWTQNNLSLQMPTSIYLCTFPYCIEFKSDSLYNPRMVTFWAGALV